ncbi:THO complex subunit 5-like protein [Labeo rohita]|uniref:THO complex subunit 5-like protein n=1 Tax=Labeo rohita TaxID=84645 RepID=A0A498P2S6_LABRO|nr:THO complex subunit 5-like protein [Labeo rohita]
MSRVQDVRVYNEEVELEGRDPQQDYMLYKDTCAALAKLMDEIQELKAGGEKVGSVEIEERRRQCSVHFITLKKLNRLAHMRLKKGRDQTHEHEEIELVSEEEFFQEAPPEISRPDVTRDDHHQLTLARLDWELEQRKRLAEQYKMSLARKEKIQKAIEQKREYLSSLQPGLQNIMQASLPVQEYLSMPFEQMQKQAEVARHLPPPLYVLLVQAGAYGQACDKNLSVSISGDVDEAKALSRPPEDSQDDESDSDAEEEQQNTKRRRATVGVQLDDKRKEMLRRHPLSLCVDLKCKDGSILHLFFYYLMNLNILTVKTKVSTTTDLSGAISAGELLNSESLLNCLYASDHGKETPNPANRYQFDKVGECQHLFPAKVVSGLTRWTMMSHQEFTELGFVQHVLKARLVCETDLFFMAVVERGTARLLAAVVVNPRYPEVTPLFSLSLHWKGERSGRTDDNLRAMESEVNVFRSELQGPRPGLQLLTNQIQRLCVCLDVYLETESQVSDGSEGPKEFPREKMCLRTARGPSRLKPFKYNHPQGFFSHR